MEYRVLPLDGYDIPYVPILRDSPFAIIMPYVRAETIFWQDMPHIKAMPRLIPVRQMKVRHCPFMERGTKP